MVVKRYRVITFSQYRDEKENKGYVKILVNAKSKELKTAILEYCKSINKKVNVVIAEALQKMIDSKDYSVSVFRGYDEAAAAGIDPRENIVSRQFSLDFSPGIINQVDKVIKQLKDENPKSKVTRLQFIQEAIKRYLEPELIRLGFINASVFKDKLVAAKNLTAFRQSLNLTRVEFIENHLTINGKPQISYPQYTAIENYGKGNIDRLLDIVAEKFKMEKDNFYKPKF